MTTVCIMKTVMIKGKHNQDKLRGGEDAVRKEAQGYGFSPSDYTHRDQVSMLNSMYLGDSVAREKCMLAILQKKINGYKAQDRRKQIFDAPLIECGEALELLVISKLRCHYCACEVMFLYERVGERKQWTLDRMDNRLGHSKGNVVVACLGCNLQRRDMSKDKFEFSKNLRVVRTD